MIYSIIVLLALALMCKIGVLHAFGIGAFARAVGSAKILPLRRASGVIISLGAVLIAMLWLQVAGYVVFEEWVFGVVFIALILAEIIYIVKLLARERVAGVERIAVVEPASEVESNLAEIIRDLIAEGEDEESVSKSFEAWAATKEYLDNGVTIQRVAAQIKSNRTYLSAYINSKYNVTFREWLTSQRLDEAQRLLVEDPEITISDVAQRVGFASVASFSRAFTRRESLSPVMWRSVASLSQEEGADKA